MPSCIVCGKFFESKRKLSGHYTWCSGKRKPKYGIENPCFGRIFSEETIKKISIGRSGIYPSSETREKMRKSQKNRWTEEEKKKHRIKMKEIANRSEVKEKLRTRMLNGGAAHANSFITNPSKPQVALFELVKQLCHCASLNYPIGNKNIDIAIPFHKIAIEYDGSYWHQDNEKDSDRQILLESLGWKFIRYRDYVPTIEELRKDIEDTR